MQNNNNLNCKIIYRLASVFLFVSSLFSILLSSETVSATTYSASISTSGSVSIDVGNVGNSTAVGTDNITVISTCPYGYNVSISGSSDRNLYKDGNSNNNVAGTYIAPSSGTTSSPTTITGNNQGTWGYSLTSSVGTGTFIGLPNTQTLLASKNSASASGGDSIPVYYGVSVASTHTPGNYKMTGNSSITYYLTTNENCFSYQVSFYANGGSGTAMANQRIYEGVATPLSTNTYTPPSGKVFIGWNTAANGSGTSYRDGQSVTDIAAMGSTLTLYAQWITPVYMQDMNFSQCEVNVGSNGNATNIGDNIIVFDRRDMSDYTVRYINGQCWMTRNLRITGAVTASESNFTGSDFNVSQYSLSSSDSSYTNHCDATNGYNYACAKDSGNVEIGVWYNYYSATAGTVATNSNTNKATSDICPAGWRLPTGPNTTSGTDLNILIGNTTGDWQSSTTGTTAFNGIATGNYIEGVFGYSTLGYWWSASNTTATGRYRLSYDSNEGRFIGNGGNSRYVGYPIRCMKERPTTLKINYGTGISGVIVKDGSPAGNTITTVRTTGTTLDTSSISANGDYYLLPLYSKGYTFNSWTASGGTVASGTYGYYHYTVAKGDNVATLSAKTLSATSSTTMQNLSSASCTAAPSTVKDSRDNNVYYIQRLADGNCWMLDNLRLGSTSTISLTTSNSNVSSSWTLPAGSTNTGASDTTKMINVQYKDNIATSFGPGSGKIGVYYNTCAASAGVVCSTSNATATYDVCPAGWRLPTGGSGSTSETKLLIDAYSTIATDVRDAFGATLSGYYGFATTGGQSKVGDYFSSITSSYLGKNTTYQLHIELNDAGSGWSGSRGTGWSIRCMRKP